MKAIQALSDQTSHSRIRSTLTSPLLCGGAACFFSPRDSGGLQRDRRKRRLHVGAGMRDPARLITDYGAPHLVHPAEV
jgi:hypothetical protein